MREVRSLLVWEKSHVFTLKIYRATLVFPAEEKFGLTARLRRSASSISANIAEGCGRDSEADFLRFLQIATGSAFETDYHLLLAHDLGYLEDDEYRVLNAEIIEIKQMLCAFIKQVRARQVIK